MKHAKSLISQADYYPKDGDQLWCVFDCDDNKDSELQAAISYSEKHGYKIAYSNPAFEYWYLLHFEKRNGYLKDSATVIDILKNKGYLENYGKSVDVFKELQEHQPEAIQYAKERVERLTRDQVAVICRDSNPVTTVYTIQFAGEEVEITCALSQGLFGDDLIIICSQETFDRIMGGTKYGLIGIQLDSNATEETIAEIRSLENDDIIITDQREGNKQNNATYWAARIVCYGFLAIIGVISLFNIVNSISMSVSARIKQYGAMRAVGMDNRQLKRMISAEAYTYAISGLIVGCGIGLPLSRFLYNRLITHYFGIEWRFPILWFGIVVAFIFISAIVSVYAPAKRIRNMPITATINEL